MVTEEAATPGVPVPADSAVLDVVVTDPIISRFAERLQAGAPRHRWRFLADAPPEVRSHALAGADVVVCARMDAKEAAACNARLVHVTGAGLDRVSVAALRPAVAVANTFHHARPIAEHVLMSILALTRRLPAASGELRAGVWRTIATDDAVPLHRTLDSMTLGVVGFGGIGAKPRGWQPHSAWKWWLCGTGRMPRCQRASAPLGGRHRRASPACWPRPTSWWSPFLSTTPPRA